MFDTPEGLYESYSASFPGKRQDLKILRLLCDGKALSSKPAFIASSGITRLSAVVYRLREFVKGSRFAIDSIQRTEKNRSGDKCNFVEYSLHEITPGMNTIIRGRVQS